MVDRYFAKEGVLAVVALSAVLLVGCLAGYFWLDQFAQGLQTLGVASVAGNDIVMGTISGFQISVSMPDLRVFLAGGAVFFEFIIIMLSMFDRVVDVLKAVVRPLLMLVPISTFLFSAYKTFSPIVRSLLPTELGGTEPGYIATAAVDDTLATNLLITFGAMLLFLLLSAILGGGSAEVNALRAELRRCRERERRG